MKVTFMHVCDYAIISRENKLSVIGIFDRINAVIFPWPQPTLFFAFQLRSGPHERGRRVSAKVQLVDQDGRGLLEAEFPLEASREGEPGEAQTFNQVMELHGFRFPAPGPYEFVIFGDGIDRERDGDAARVRFDVVSAKAPDA